MRDQMTPKTSPTARPYVPSSIEKMKAGMGESATAQILP